MGIEHEVRTFSEPDVAEIVAEMGRRRARADGADWLRVRPDVEEQEVSTGSRWWKLFSNRGPVIPEFTWVPGRGSEPTQLGLMHAAGRGTPEKLVEVGVRPPPEWVLIQDDQKRGVIFAAPPDADLTAMVKWSMAALRRLSPFQFEEYYEARFSSS